MTANCRLPGIGSLLAALQAKSTLRLCQPPKRSCLPHSGFFLGRANLFLRDLIGRKKSSERSSSGPSFGRFLAAKIEFSYGARSKRLTTTVMTCRNLIGVRFGRGLASNATRLNREQSPGRSVRRRSLNPSRSNSLASHARRALPPPADTNRWVRPNPSPELGVLRAGPHARLRQSLSLFVLSVPRPLLLGMK